MHLKPSLAVGRRAAMRGLSLVELMVGVAVSLFVVAAAALLVSSQLADNRRLLLETQLQQDLRATADIVTREMRRIGYLSNHMTLVPSPAGGTVVNNIMSAFSVSSSASSAIYYKYRRASGIEAFGFRLADNGAVMACQSDGSEPGGQCNVAWQELSDPNTVRIREFRITAERSTNSANDDLQTLPCAFPCPDGTASCWPKVGVRELTLVLTGESRSDAAVVRTLRSSVRVRNDAVNLSSDVPTGRSCPAG